MIFFGYARRQWSKEKRGMALLPTAGLSFPCVKIISSISLSCWRKSVWPGPAHTHETRIKSRSGPTPSPSHDDSLVYGPGLLASLCLVESIILDEPTLTIGLYYVQAIYGSGNSSTTTSIRNTADSSLFGEVFMHCQDVNY